MLHRHVRPTERQDTVPSAQGRPQGPRRWSGIGRRVIAGAFGGLSGGVVFGFLQAQLGMFSLNASIVGSDSAGVGLLVHLALSVLVGVGLAVPFAQNLLTGYRQGLLAGMGFGVLWWAVSGLLILPRTLGLPPVNLTLMVTLSLAGHLIYGAVLGLTAVRVLKHRRT